ncbi:MAG: DegT/DnrJ/EryC1/StrS family aminotransferase [Candidatus Cloacimonetes bacterium]|nr:DegT/DnrJ/EryC1/StrS family aminotransferase [Candidatus Cloacimonadota bacterium]
MSGREIKLQVPTYSKEEVATVNEILASTMVVMGQKTREFQHAWSNWQNANYSTMVNSGSSANLLIANLLLSKRGQYCLNKGDEVLIPAVTWSTTLFPFVQLGLKPVLVDVSPTSFNISIESCQKALTSKTRAVFAVHLLGNPANMDELVKFCNEHNLVLLEDCCEATGAMWDNKRVGNFGEASAFSFMFAHHMSTIEGGMICCRDKQDDIVLKASRAHGWIREMDEESQKEIKAQHDFDDYRFMFWDMGFNVRPTEISAVFGLEQLKRIEDFIKIRINNFLRYYEKFSKLDSEIQVQELEDTNKAFRSNFSFGIVLKRAGIRKKFIQHLKENGIDSRLLVAGNLARHPFYNHYCAPPTVSLQNADKIHENGLYLPNHQAMTPDDVDYIYSVVRNFFYE